MCNRSRLTPVEVHARSFSIKCSIKSGEPVDAKARDSYTRGAKPDDGGTLLVSRSSERKRSNAVRRGGEAVLYRDRVRNKKPTHKWRIDM